MFNKYNNEKLDTNSIKIVVKIDERSNPELQSFGMNYIWIDKPPKDIFINQMDKLWEQLKSKILEELYSD